MKTRTRKLIAAITATALLGSALGVSAYAVGKTDNNDFGFKGTYSLNAFAETETATASTVTVDGVSIDVTSTLTLVSNDKTYTLFVSVIDVDDFDALENVSLGYTVSEKVYNGTKAELSNVVYSSLTVKTDDVGSLSSLYAYELAEKYTTITTAKLVIAEVKSTDLSSGSAELTINGTAISAETTTYAYNSDGFKNADGTAMTVDKNVTTEETKYWASETTSGANLEIQPGVILEGNSKSITVGTETYSYTNRLKLNGAPGTTTSKSVKIELTKRSSVTVHGMSGNNSDVRSLVVLDSTGSEIATVMTTPGDKLYEGVVNLNPGTYYLATGTDATGGYNLYGILIGAPIKVTYTLIEEKSATCGEDGVAAHYEGSDGKLYVKTNGEYVETTEDKLVIAATGEHTASENWLTSSAGHWHKCTGCSTVLDYEDHVDNDNNKVCDTCDVAITDTIDLSVDTSSMTITNGTEYVAGTEIYKDSLITLTSNESVTYTTSLDSNQPTNPFDSSTCSAAFKNTTAVKDTTGKFVFTASKDVTLTIYYTIADTTYKSNRGGTMNFEYNDIQETLTLTTSANPRKTMITKQVTLKAGQALSIYCTSLSGNGCIYLFGWNAKT